MINANLFAIELLTKLSTSFSRSLVLMSPPPLLFSAPSGLLTLPSVRPATLSLSLPTRADLR